MISRPQPDVAAHSSLTNDVPPRAYHTAGEAGNSSESPSRAWSVGKRIFDIVASVALLVASLPLMLVVALLVKLDSRGPLIFRQRRYGRALEPFNVWKFRTMYDGVSSEVHRRYIAELAAGAHAGAPGLKKLTADPRVTRVGALLRRTSLDELPQLVNVLRGQMSLVGPRPALEYEFDHYAAVHFDRFLVRPGLTGLWQVSGRSRCGFQEMLDLDVVYAHACGPRMDAMILWRTPRAVLERQAA